MGSVQIKGVFYFYPDNYVVTDVGSAALFTDDTHPKPAVFEFSKFQLTKNNINPPVFTSISIKPNPVKNGDSIEVVVVTDETGLFITADISELDSTKTEPVVLTRQPDDTYLGSTSISYGNVAQNGDKIIQLNAIDLAGNSSVVSIKTELQNFTPVLDVVPPDDDFQGTVLDVSKWKLQINGGGIVTQDGKLILTVRSSPANSNVTTASTWQFTGDFDVQVDFQIGNGWAVPAQEHLDGATLGASINGQVYHLTRLRSSSEDKLFPWSSAFDINVGMPTTAISGKYRLVRSGATLVLLYDIGSGWQELAEVKVPSAPAEIYLANGSVNASHEFTTYFGNFQINSGLTTYEP